MSLKVHQLINQDSGDTEYYTPKFITDAAREVMGCIDLDPASSLKANQSIQAKKIFTVKDDGLIQEWFGNIFMNHPFSREGNRDWIRKLMAEYDRDIVRQFTCITFAATSEAWFQPLNDFAQCYLTPRTNYVLPDGSIKKGVSKGSVVTYGGYHLEDFIRVFSKLGAVKIPADMYLERVV